MDPMTAALIIRGLDIAFTFATYAVNREESLEKKAYLIQQLTHINTLQGKLADGTISAEQAKVLLDDTIENSLADLHAAMDRL